jgi:signal transduction histidine kinase
MVSFFSHFVSIIKAGLKLFVKGLVFSLAWLFFISLQVQASIDIKTEISQDCNQHLILTQNTSYFIDPTTRLAFDQIKNREFTKAPKGISEGFSRSVVWLKIDIPLAIQRCMFGQAGSKHWVLKIDQPYHDKLDIFLPNEGEQTLTHWSLGDQRPVHSLLGKQRTPVVPLSLLDDNAVIYIRVQSQNALNISYQIVSQQQHDSNEQIMLYVSAFAGAMLLVTILLGLVAMVVLQAWQIISFVGFVTSITVILMFIYGWLNLFLPPSWADPLSLLAHAIGLLTLLLLTNSLLRLQVYFGLLYKLALVTVLAIVGFAFYSAFNHQYQLSIQITQIFIMLFVILFTLLALGLIKKEVIAKSYLIVFSLLFVAIFVRLLNLHGFIATNFVTENILAFVLVLQVLFLLTLIVYKFYDQKTQLLKFEEKMDRVSDELNYRRTFMNLLSHELMTPIAVLDIGLRNLQDELDANQSHLKSTCVKQKQVLDKMRRLVSVCLDQERYLHNGQMQQFKLEQLWLELHNEVEGSYEEKRLIWVESIEADWQMIELKGDLGSLVLAISLVLHNAFKYSPRDTKVFFSIRIETESVSFRVKDFGVGFTKATLSPQAFQRGENVAQTTGLGIGLTLAQDIAQNHGGKLVIDSLVEDSYYHDFRGNRKKHQTGSLVSIVLPRSLSD